MIETDSDRRGFLIAHRRASDGLGDDIEPEDDIYVYGLKKDSDERDGLKNLEDNNPSLKRYVRVRVVIV